MYKAVYATLILLICVVPGRAQRITPDTPVFQSLKEAAVTSGVAKDMLAQTPLGFEAASSGQSTRFTTSTWDYSLAFANASASIHWLEKNGKDASITMRWPGSRAGAAPEGLERQHGVSNYLTGSDPAQWRTGVAHYGRVRYPNIYPGVDLLFYGDGQKLEYDFVVAPHADPSRIRMEFDGASRLSLDAKGELSIFAHGRTIRQSLPAIYQTIGGVRRSVSGRFVLEGSAVRIALGDYDRSLALVIDPAVITASLGAAGATVPREVVVDAQGNLYVVGGSAAADLPGVSTGAQPAYGGGGADVFVSKFDAQGNLAWVTYLGGSGNESSGGIALDRDGNIYVAGYTDSTNFPPNPSGFQKTRAGGTDVFLVKLNPAGSAILASTYFGGTANDIPTNLQLDSAGNVYICGATGSANLPVKSAAQSTGGGGLSDGFIAKFRPDLSDLVYSTFLGGSSEDRVELIRVDGKGNAYATGYTLSTNFKTIAGAAQSTNKGGRDVFVVRLDPAGALAMSTLLGGSKDDSPLTMALAPSGDIYVGGTTASANFPMLAKGFQTTYGGDPTDGFLVRLTPAGALAASTFMGGPGDDSVNGLAYTSDGSLNVLVTLGSNIVGSSSKARASVSLPLLAYYIDKQGDLESFLYYHDFSYAETGALRGCTVGETHTCCTGTVTDQATGVRSCKLLCILNGLIGRPALSSNFDNPQAVAEPISTATGELYLAQTDLARSGVMGLEFSRYYSSHLSSNNLSSALGLNWMHNYETVLSVLADTAKVLLYPGKTVSFKQAGGGWVQSSALSTGYQFAVTPGGYQLLDPTDNHIYTFGPSGALTRIEDRNGNALTITQGSVGPVSISDGAGRTLAFTYTGSQLTKVEDQSGRSVLFGYTGNNLTSVTDPLASVTKYSYATSGQYAGLLTAALKPAGNTPQTQTFDDQGRVSKQTDASGNTMKMSYDGDTTTITDPLSVSAQHTYSNGALSKIVDPDQQTISMSYDSSNRLTALTDRNGGVTQYTSHAASGYPASSTDSLGNTTTFSYTAQPQGGFTFYNLTGIAYSDGSTAALTYDAKGNILTQTDAAGRKTTFTYTPRGLRATSTSPSGATATFTYNSDNTLASVKGPTGDVTSFAYDSAKRVSKITQADGSVRELTHDALDNVTSIKNEMGDSRSFTFDSNNRIATATDYLGGVKSYRYDANDQISAFVDELGNAVTYTYDEQNRLSSTTTPNGYRVKQTYNSQGRVIGLSDDAGPLWTKTFDREALPASTTDALGRTWKTTRDAVGQVSQVTAPSGASSSITYDKLGRILQATDASSVALAYTYDAAGLVASASQGNTVTAKFTRDADGNRTRINDANGKNWDSAFDGAGRLVSQKDPLGNVTTFEYNTRQLVSKVNMPSASLNVTYNAAGRPIRRLYSDGVDLQFTYNKTGQLTAANGVTLAYDAARNMVSSNGIGVGRDSSGRIATVTMGAGRVVTYTYNDRGLLSSVRDWTGGGMDFTFDASRALAGISRTNGVSTAFAYDSDANPNSIVDSGASGVIASIALIYDGAGKVLSSDRNLPGTVTLPAVAQAYTYDAASQISGATYDALGRLTGDGSRKFSWDAASRLTAYTPSAGVSPVAFSYDAFGSMIGRGSRTFVVNYALGQGAVGIVRDGATDTRYYVHTPGGLLLYSVEADGGVHRFYHFDESGNTVYLTGDTGDITDTYGITPFGETVIRTGQSDNPFTFQGVAGVMQEGSSSLYYMRARFYDGATARFLSRDPLSIPLRPLSVNPYQYAELNPITNADPSGLGTLTAVNQKYIDAFGKLVAETVTAEQTRRRQVAAYQDWLASLSLVERAALAIASDRANQLAKQLGYPAGDPRIQTLTQILWNASLDVVEAKGGTHLNQAALSGADVLGKVSSILSNNEKTFTNNVSSLLHQDGSGLLHQDGSGLIMGALNSLLHQDGSGLILGAATGVVAQGGGNLFNLATTLLNQDGSGIIGHSGSTFH